MKRTLLHFIFWLVYYIQDTFLHYTWMGPILPETSENKQFLMAMQTALVILPPKLLMVYYFINRGVKKLINANWLSPRLALEILMVTSIAVVLFRLTFHYIVTPGIYGLETKYPALNARNILISILELGYITGVAITLKLLRLQVSSREREQNLVKEKLQTELKFLKNQTNPHFLFNTLNNIYALARKKSDKTADVVMKLSELLSFMLYESGKDTITVAEEIKMLEDYIELEKIRYNERLSIRLDKNIDDPARAITPLILLPLVENAFKHGASETRFDSYIHITITLQNGKLGYMIENSFENDKTKNANQCIGLNNIKRQLELMYKEHEMDVVRHEKTFKVIITINLDSYGKI